jgi:hypothetical protein
MREPCLIQPSSVPVDRRARRAKTDALDVEMLLRTTLAWLRGEPRVCSMVPILSEAEEDGRREQAAVTCPCGCGQVLHMNLLTDERPC